MATKTISILEEAYQTLLNRKRNNESFSDVILREFSSKGKITEGAGVWSDMSDEEAEAITSRREKTRELTRRSIIEKLR